MVAAIFDACANIESTLDLLISGGTKKRYEICNWTEGDSAVFELYASAVRHLVQKLGAPTYAGKGGAYARGNDGANPGIFIHDYSHSLEISWWKNDKRVFVVLVSGHDANSLLCFSAAHYETCT